MTTAVSSDRRRAADPIGWRGLAGVTAGLTILVLVLLRRLLFAGTPVLPGTDASNLYAWELYTRAVLAASRLPHWNPLLFGGTPHLADTQTTVFYPVAWMLRWMAPAPFLSWMAAAHLIIGGVGAALLARVVGLGWTAAAAAAVAVTLGGSAPAWIYNGHLLLLYGTAWLPWILAAALVSFRRASWWPHPALVLLAVVQVLAGYLQGTLYIAATVVACALWSVVWPPQAARGLARCRPLGQIVLAGILAAGLAAFQLWPTLQLLAAAGRTAGLPYADAARGAWSPGDLATWLFPFASVSPETPFRNLADRTAYVGWVLVALVPLAFIDRPRRRTALLFTVLAAGSVAFALASTLPLYRLHFLLFPGLRVPGRWLFIATLAVAMLGAMGLDRLLAGLRARQRGSLAVVVAVLLLVGITADLAAYGHGSVQLSTPDPAPALAAIPPGPGRTLSVCDRALGAMDLVIGGRPAADGAGAVGLASYADFLALARDDGALRMRRDLLNLLNVTAVVSCVPLAAPGLRQVGTADPGVVMYNEAAWPRALWTCGGERMTRRDALEHLRRVRYDDDRHLDRRYFVNIRWSGAVDEAQRRALEARYRLAAGVQGDGRTWRYDLRDRSAANVQALLGDEAVEDTHGIDRETGTLATDSAEPADHLLFGTAACAASGAVTGIEADRPGGDVRMVSDAPVEGLVFTSEPHYPERVAYVDDRAVQSLRADVAFMAIPVPAGRHVIEIRYVPGRFHQGLAVSSVTLLAWLAAAWWRRGRRPVSGGQAAA